MTARRGAPPQNGAGPQLANWGTGTSQLDTDSDQGSAAGRPGADAIDLALLAGGWVRTDVDPIHVAVVLAELLDELEVAS